MRTVLTILMASMSIGCAPPKAKPNQSQNALSPSGKYVVAVPIEKNTTNATYRGTPVWKVTILDTEGNTIYKDEDSTFVGTLNVYWGWDASDTLWLYNSDDGRIWRWERNDDGWEKIEGQGQKRIPEYVLPDYARRRLTSE